MSNKLTKTVIKSIVKECLIEILAEGIYSNNSSNSLTKKKKAINKITGARGLRAIIEALLLKTMFKLPTMNDVEEVIINQLRTRIDENRDKICYILGITKKIPKNLVDNINQEESRLFD